MDERPLDLAVLRTFSPLDGLKAENLHALARKTHIRELGAGRVLFKEGDTDKRTFYLVAGNVELRTDDRLIGTISAGTPEARVALAPGLPRKFTARAAANSRMWVLRASACRFSAFRPSSGEKVLRTARSRGRSSIEQCAAFNPMILVANPTIGDGRSAHAVGHRGEWTTQTTAASPGRLESARHSAARVLPAER